MNLGASIFPNLVSVVSPAIRFPMAAAEPLVPTGCSAVLNPEPLEATGAGVILCTGIGTTGL